MIKKAIRFIRSRWRWFTAAGVLLLVSVAALLLRQNQIAAALQSHHTRPGVSVRVSILSAYPVSALCPDSLRRVSAGRDFTRFSGVYIDLLRMGADATAAPYSDSISAAKNAVLHFDSLLALHNYPAGAYTLCRYVAAFSGESVQYSDTLTAVLNKKRRVVWPD